MSYDVILSKLAKKNLLDISDYISAYNPSRALTFIQELYDRAHSLKDFPYRFQVRGKNRRIVHGNYVIAYRVNETKKIVTITSISEGHRLNTQEKRGIAAP
jgi:toxin ParE1/3/4